MRLRFGLLCFRAVCPSALPSTRNGPAITLPFLSLSDRRPVRVRSSGKSTAIVTLVCPDVDVDDEMNATQALPIANRAWRRGIKRVDVF